MAKVQCVVFVHESIITQLQMLKRKYKNNIEYLTWSDEQWHKERKHRKTYTGKHLQTRNVYVDFVVAYMIQNTQRIYTTKLM